MSQRIPEPFDDDFLARLQRLEVLAKRLGGRGGGSSQRSRRLGDGLEFADHRPYSPGDDVRFIDWPYYARMERLLLRMFHQHSESPVVIMLDTSASMAAGEQGGQRFDYARRVTAAIAILAAGGLRRVEIQPFADRLARPATIPPGRSGLVTALQFLAALTAGGVSDFAGCARGLAGRLEPGGSVMLVSDLADMSDSLRSGLSLLGRSSDAVVLHVFAPADAAPTAGGPMELQAAEAGTLLAVRADARLLAEYARQWQLLQTHLRRLCRAERATYVAAPADVPLERLILLTLRRAGVLQ